MIKGKVILNNIELYNIENVLRILKRFEKLKLFVNDNLSNNIIQVTLINKNIITTYWEQNICKKTFHFDITMY